MDDDEDGPESSIIDRSVFELKPRPSVLIFRPSPLANVGISKASSVCSEDCPSLAWLDDSSSVMSDGDDSLLTSESVFGYGSNAGEEETSSHVGYAWPGLPKEGNGGPDGGNVFSLQPRFSIFEDYEPIEPKEEA